MADTKISSLPNGDPVVATDALPIVRAGANLKVTASKFLQFGPFASDYLILPNEQGGGALFTTGFFGPQGTGIVNGVGTIQITISRYLQVNNGGIVIGQTDAGKFAFYGIYDLAGNLLTKFKFSTTSLGNILSVASPTVLLSPNTYILGVGGDTLVARGTGYQFDTSLQNFQFNNGVANNLCTPGAGGGMPATLGGLLVNTQNQSSWASLVLLP